MAERIRSKPFTEEEHSILYLEAGKEAHAIENKKSDATSIQRKRAAWERVASNYNSHHLVHRRSAEQLRKCWDNIKARRKKQIAEDRRNAKATGSRPPPKTKTSDTQQIHYLVPHLLHHVPNEWDSDRDVSIPGPATDISLQSDTEEVHDSPPVIIQVKAERECVISSEVPPLPSVSSPCPSPQPKFPTISFETYPLPPVSTPSPELSPTPKRIKRQPPVLSTSSPSQRKLNTLDTRSEILKNIHVEQKARQDELHNLRIEEQRCLVEGAKAELEAKRLNVEIKRIILEREKVELEAAKLRLEKEKGAK